MKDAKVCPPSKGLFTKVYKKVNVVGNIFFLLIGISTICYGSYDNYRKATIYKSLDMSFLSARVVEYGTEEIDTRGFIENIDEGVIKDYTKSIDTTSVGVQKVKYEIGIKDVTKEFDTEIKVVDTKPPVIEFNEDIIYIYQGATFDAKSNIKSVRDEIDGDIAFTENEKEEKKDYYVIYNNLDTNKIDTHEIKVVAYDKNGNETAKSFYVKVIAKPQPRVTTYSYSQPSGSYTGAASIDTSSVVATARSLVGYRYVYAGESPSIGFDCSGLVKYVYGVHGTYLGHGTYAQAGAGQAVSRANMQPGDIIIWSTYSNNAPTHSSIYIGGDQMIHAANSGTGVIQSSVSWWESAGGGHIATIRRV